MEMDSTGWTKALMVLLSLGLTACGSKTSAPLGTELSKSTLDENERMDVTPATSEECPQGGYVYRIYADANGNGVRDVRESVGSAQVVCNGVDGANGVDGRDGVDGVNGANGSDGISLVFDLFPAAAPMCSEGGSTILVARDTHVNDVLDSEDDDMKSATLCNGQSAPMSDYTPVDLIMPCGDTVPNKEVLLRLHDGQVLAVFSANTGGDMTRLSVLHDGTFIDTDTSGCVFTLQTSDDGHMRSISWSGQVQQTCLLGAP
jgi:hypothetical protein